MNLRQVEAFKAVMTTGTVTEAAGLLHISQPAVSRLIAELERATGLELFSRSKKRLRPTPEALAFHEEVKRAFVGLDALDRRAKDIRNFRSGNLRIASLPALGFGFVPKVAAAFMDEYPDVSLSIQTRSSATVRELVSLNQFDIGLAGSALDVPGCDIEPFVQVEGVCILPKDHRLAKKSIIRPKDLAQENFISLVREDMTRTQIEKAFDESGTEYRAAVETQFSATACALVMEGYGITIASPITANDFRDRGLIVKPFSPPIYFESVLLFPSDKPKSRLAQSFVDKLLEARNQVLSMYG